MTCPNCGSNKNKKNGKREDVQRKAELAVHDEIVHASVEIHHI